MFVIITMWSWFVNCSGYRRFLVVAIGFSYSSCCRSFHFNFLLILLFFWFQLRSMLHRKEWEVWSTKLPDRYLRFSVKLLLYLLSELQSLLLQLHLQYTFMSICFLQVKQIMVDQKDIYLNNPIIVRHYPLEENINYCFVGIRRTGKSYMMYQQNAQQRNCFYTGRPFCHHEYISLFLLWVSDCKWKRKELSGYYQHKW